MYYYLKLMRPEQWFKNLIIFAPLLLYGYLFNTNALLLTVAGFIVFCIASSLVYIFNDISDAEADRMHPTKRFRPIASGKISKMQAVVFSILLIIPVTFLTRMLLEYVHVLFSVLVFSLIVLTLLYSYIFKSKPVLDLMFISFNFCIRCAAGFVLIGRSGDPWFLVSVFFLALFLVLGKRKVELNLLGKNAVKHRSIYRFYREEFISGMTYMIITLMLISYAILTYFSLGAGWVTTLTVPIASFIAFRYLFFINSNSDIAAHPEFLVKDKQMIGALAVWVLILFCFVYLSKFGLNPINIAIHGLKTLI